MSFLKKIWKDTIAEYPNRRTLTDITDGTAKTYAVTRDVGIVTQSGDVFNASTMNNLEGRIAEAFGYTDYLITTIWSANTSIGDFATYPFKQTISTDVITDNRDCLVLGANASAMPTKEEMDEFAKICQFVDFSNGITVLASEETTVALTLRVKGV